MSCRREAGTLCGIEEGNLPPCEQALDAESMCPVHCRAHVKTCNVCEYRFTREDADLEACPECTKDRHCSKRHVKGRVRCKNHGGRSRAGLASPRLKSGDRSRYLDVLGAKDKREYQKAKGGPDPLSLEEDISLLDMRVRQLLGGEPTPEHWKEVRKTFEEFASAQAAKDRDASVAALQKLAQLIRGGEDEARRWREIERLAFVRRPRIALSETRRKVHLAEMIQWSWVVDFLLFLSESLRRNVKDPQALDTITTDIRRGARGLLPQLLTAGDGVERDGDD
ncbi:MAG TPA: hypothetical protein VIP46_02625 [Pyrinomonadaceae bacterium]